MTIAACVVSGAPPAPSIGARGAQVTCIASRSPGLLSCGAIVAGDHRTSQFPAELVRRRLVLIAIVPTPLMGMCSVTGSCAVLPVTLMRPGRKLSWLAPRSVSAAALTAVKLAGGLAVSARIPAQSRRAQSRR